MYAFHLLIPVWAHTPYDYRNWTVLKMYVTRKATSSIATSSFCSFFTFSSSHHKCKWRKPNQNFSIISSFSGLKLGCQNNTNHFNVLPDKNSCCTKLHNFASFSHLITCLLLTTFSLFFANHQKEYTVPIIHHDTCFLPFLPFYCTHTCTLYLLATKQFCVMIRQSEILITSWFFAFSSSSIKVLR